MNTQNEWFEFYAPFFPSECDARAFLEDIEALPTGDRRHPAKVMMHQTKRLVSLADDLPRIRPNCEALQLLFLLICAEHIAKMFEDFTRDGESRRYVRKFFQLFLSPEQQEQFSSGVQRPAFNSGPFSEVVDARWDAPSSSSEALRKAKLMQAVDAFYDVRCDVVHEGGYDFHFRVDGGEPMVNDVIVVLTADEFRRFVVVGCITAIQRYSPAA